jgi:hypothetical protein
MCPDTPYFIILLCLMTDNFTCQGESAATQWVKSKLIGISIFHTVFSQTMSPDVYSNHILEMYKVQQKVKLFF